MRARCVLSKSHYHSLFSVRVSLKQKWFNSWKWNEHTAEMPQTQQKQPSESASRISWDQSQLQTAAVETSLGSFKKTVETYFLVLVDFSSKLNRFHNNECSWGPQKCTSASRASGEKQQRGIVWRVTTRIKIIITRHNKLSSFHRSLRLRIVSAASENVVSLSSSLFAFVIEIWVECTPRRETMHLPCVLQMPFCD